MRRPRLLVLLVVGIAPVACTDDGDDTPAATAPAATATTTTVAPADSEFCQRMVALATEDDEPVDDDELPDAAQQVLDVYREVLPIAPFEISAELQAVIDRMERELAGETLTDDELAIADESAYRVSLFVDLNCEGVSNNPGPPATVPE